MSQIQRNPSYLECKRRRVTYGGNRPDCSCCVKNAIKRSDCEFNWQVFGTPLASLHGAPLSSYATPPTVTLGVPSISIAEASPGSQITISPQPPRSEWPAPLRLARQNSAAFSQSSDPTTLFNCLYPQCTSEFQDEASLECHMMVHFKDNQITQPSCDSAGGERWIDKAAHQFSLFEPNRVFSPVTGSEQSSYSAASASTSRWHNDMEFTADYLRIMCPSNSYTSPSCPSTSDPSPSGSSDYLDLDSPSRYSTVGNLERPNPLLWPIMLDGIQAQLEEASSCHIPACGRTFARFGNHFSHMRKYGQRRAERDLETSMQGSELARQVYADEEPLFAGKKRNRNSEYADSAYGSSIEPEEKLANKRSKAARTENVRKSVVMASSELKHEADSLRFLAGTTASTESSIRVMSPDHARRSETIPLPFGHPKSRNWKQMVSSIRDSTQAILGNGNGGAIELFCVDGEPTVCVTCWHPPKVDQKILAKCMQPLDLPILISRGRIRKSTGGHHPEESTSVRKSRFREPKPPIHGHYMRRPDCGASLGVSEGPLSPWKVSLGGYLKLKYTNRNEWATYAMTVHHVLVEERPYSHASSGGCNDEEEAIIEPGYDYSPGVRDGVFSGAEDSAKNINFSSPAVPDLEDSISRLESRLAKCRNSEQYAKIDNVKNLDSLLKELRHSDCTNYGRAAWSSGLTLAEGVEMDWLLIDSIPTQRIGRNCSGDVAAFMEGSNVNVDGSWQNWTPTEYVDEAAFETLMDFTSCGWDEKEPTNYGFMSRVYGRGSEAGLADGYLSPNPSLFYDPVYGPYDAWAFCPRKERGLGYSGDSGTWIYTSEGKLLGQIISYNRDRHITYFTPICKAFKHIKQVTGATELKLLAPDHTGVPYGLLSPEESPRSLPKQTHGASVEGRVPAPLTRVKTLSTAPRAFPQIHN